MSVFQVIAGHCKRRTDYPHSDSSFYLFCFHKRQMSMSISTIQLCFFNLVKGIRVL